MYTTLKKMLETHHIAYEEITHEASTSCEHSATLRAQYGWTNVGGKNIVFHAKGNWYLVTTLGHKEIKARNFKKPFGTKDIRFATQEEITTQHLGVIGSIAPFGFENETIPLFVDKEIFSHEYFSLNPFDPTRSIRLATKDLYHLYQVLPNPVFIFEESHEGLIFTPLISE